MSSKRAAAEAESSASDFSYASSSSDEKGEQEEDVRLSSVPQVPKPMKPSKHPSAATSSHDGEEDDDDSSNEEDGQRNKHQGDNGSEEEEDDDDEGSSDEGSDSDDANTMNKPLPPPPPPPPPPPKPQFQPLPKPTPEPSDSGSSGDSDSESDSSDDAPVTPASRPSRAVDPSIKPINTKPMDTPNKPSKQANSPAPLQDRESLKRKHDVVERSELDNHGGQKRQLFQRLWSLDNEIVLLKGLVEYRSKKGTVAASAHDMEDLRNFIKGSFQTDFSNTQLADKVRRLKKKFETNNARAKNGADPTFTKPHEQDGYKLSKKVWGVNRITSEHLDANSADSEDNEESESEMMNIRKSNEQQLTSLVVSKCHDAIVCESGDIVRVKIQFPYLWETVTKMADEYLCGIAIKRALEMVDVAKAKSMEEKLKKLKTTQMRQHLRRIDLNKETVKLILDAIGRSK
ncbi:unnamed protein product [Musa acuminata subsp. malaccensis]|uniref:(wild Malaysian banana) hypothetical protein n=1 Tax=Musa acuminata subsp. malaccensis TaxID=214687 RepID=A0A804KLX5_MUSAM|nr:PREDICTED: STOREKEEPER protein-like [Musa acuminata subsp. malaccensis]CAG1835829.1 unnamed protein product [Musa acuminata subsp. malaccensis]